MQLTTIDGIGTNLIVIRGMTMADGRVLYGVFANGLDFRSENADAMAIAIVGRDRLSDEQAEIAERNAEEVDAYED